MSTRRWTVPLSGLAPARRALERLGSDEAVLRAAHAEFYAGVALTYAERPGTRRRYDELGREGRNIEAALTWLCAADRITEALTVVETLDPYWRQTGQLEFARDRYVELLRASAGLDPERVRRLRPAAAAVFARVGEPETARALVPEWPADAAGDLDTAMVAYLQGIVAAADDPDQAVTCYDRAGSGGDPDVAASARLDLALLHLRRQRATTARRVAEEILVRATYGGEDRIAGAALLRLGAIAAVAGPPAAAAGYFHRGLSRLRPLGVAVLTGELVDLIGSYLIEDVAMRTANTARMVGLLHAPRWPTGLLSRPEDLLARLDHRAVRDALLDPTVPLIAALTELAAASFGGGTSESSQAAWEALTRRQWEVARCIGDGLTNKQAARRLAIRSGPWSTICGRSCASSSALAGSGRLLGARARRLTGAREGPPLWGRPFPCVLVRSADSGVPDERERQGTDIDVACQRVRDVIGRQ